MGTLRSRPGNGKKAPAARVRKAVRPAQKRAPSALERALVERDEALRFQAATGEILAALIHSTADAQPVFDAIAKNVLRLFGMRYAAVFLVRGDEIHLAAAHADAQLERKQAAQLAQFRAAFPQKIDYQGFTGKTLRAGEVGQLVPVLGNPASTPQAEALARSFGYNAMLVAPLMREGRAIGAIGTTHPQAKRFEKRELALLQAFADQAVIAIENARLFRELEEKNRGLTTALSQQTATAEILRAISTALTDLQPVLDTIVQSGLRLLSGYSATMTLLRGDELHLVAYTSTGAPGDKSLKRFFPVALDDLRAAARAVRERRSQAIEDIESADESPSLRAAVRSRGWRSALFVPLIRGEEVLGILAVTRSVPGAFAADEVALLETFASQAVIAFENVRLFNETKEALEQQTAISEVLRVMAGTPADVQPMLNAVAERAARICESSDARIFLVDGERLVHAAGAGDLPAVVDEFPVNRDTPSGRAVVDRVPVQVDDVEAPSAAKEFPLARGFARRAGWRTIMSVPLLRQGRALGTIALRRREVRPFSAKQIALLKTFADQAAIAIENARLFNETREALERQTATSEVLKTISRSTFDLDAVLQVLIENATRLAGASKGFIFRFDGQVARLAFSYNAPPAYRALIEANPIPPGRGSLVGRTLLERRAVHIPDVLSDPEFTWKEAQRLGGFRSMLGVPMIREGKLIGVIAMWSDVVKPFTDKQIELVSTFADQAVIAIENVRLFNETKEALERQTAIAEILRVMSSSPSDVAPVLQAVIEHAVRLSGADNGSVVRIDSGVGSLVASRGMDEERRVASEAFYREHPLTPGRESLTGRVLLERRSVQIEDIEADPEFRLPEGSIYHAMLGVPLVRAGEIVGVIILRRKSPVAFTGPQVQLVEAFAHQAVIAIENVRLFNETKEALDRQTATAEILKIISASPTDVQPVFEAIAQSAVRLCRGMFANVFRFDGELVHYMTSAGLGLEGVALQRAKYPMPPTVASVSGRVILSGATTRILDSRADADYDQTFVVAAGGARRILGVPMKREDRVLGAIVVAWETVGPIATVDEQLLTTFADQAAIAVENTRLFNETKEALERQTATADILKVISSSPTDTQPVFEAIVQSAARLFEHCSATVTMVEGGLLNWRASAGPHYRTADIEEIRKVFPIPLDSREAPSARAIAERRVLEITDTELAGDLTLATRSGRAGRFRSAVFVPLVHGANGIGTIVLTHPQPGFRLSPAQLSLVQTFADQAVIAIENVRLFNETKEALERQTATANILRVISGSPTDVQPVFDAILESATRLCEAQLGGLYLTDGEIWSMVAFRGEDPSVQEVFRGRRPGPHTGLGRLARTRAPVHIHDLRAEGEEALRDPVRVATLERLKARTFLAVPLLKEGTVLGAVVIYRREVQPFTEAQIGLLTTFADQAVIAIENVRLFNETKEALEQQKASGEVLGTISASIADAQPVFEKIAESCLRLFEGHTVGISVVDEDGLARLAAYRGGKLEELQRGFPLPVDESSGTGAAILKREVVHFPDTFAEDAPEALRSNCLRTGTRALIVAPMLWESRGIGAVFVGRLVPGAFPDKVIRLLKTFADQAVIAIQNARLFREIQEKSAQLEVANKHKSDFLANMSHELRTPLNAIIGFSEVLLERMFGEVNEKQVEYLKDIHESGRHLLSLINDILDLSKIEAGRMELELSSFHLPTAVSNAMTLVRERAQRHGIALGAEIDPALGEFEGDERKVKQILLNLLSNAVKFTPDGGRVDVAARKMNGRIEIEVRDTGIGIAAEDQKLVFEEFKQVGRDYTRKAEGTGLGLALTRRLVELHGGEILLASEPGKGSTFTVRLPLG